MICCDVCNLRHNNRRIVHPNHRSSACCAANRAFASLKLESYGSAISDSGAALAIDPSFVKAYYRRGSAKLALGKHKAARDDFRSVVKLKPSDKDARAKLDECEKAVKRKAFEEAIAMESTKPAWERLGPAADALSVDPGYSGPHLPEVPKEGAPTPSPAELMADESRVNEHGISLGFVKGLMGHLKAQKHLHRKYALQLLCRLHRLLSTYRSLVTVEHPSPEAGGDPAARFNVCGDTHGQYYDTLNLFGEW